MARGPRVTVVETGGGGTLVEGRVFQRVVRVCRGALGGGLRVAAVGLLAMGGAAAEDADASGHLRGYAMPIVGFDSNNGLGAGGRVEIARMADGYAPYRSRWVAHGYATRIGFHDHRLRWDRVGLGQDGRVRVSILLAWRQWARDHYWGVGNQTQRMLGSAETRYSHSLRQPLAQMSVRRRVGEGAWSTYGGLSPRHTVVLPAPGSLLAEERPYGLSGGSTVQVSWGVLRDSRSPEIAPRRGSMVDLGARLSPDIDGEAGGFGGGLVSARGFLPLGGRTVVAVRAMSEWLIGRVPFYEMSHWGGVEPFIGFGGTNTVRGMPSGRWRGPAKAVANLELRFDAASHALFGHSVRWELSPFADAGVVWGTPGPTLGPFPPVHPGVGGGVRVVLDETFVGRVDAAAGRDLVRTQTGDVRASATTGLYLAFGHPF